MPCWQTVGIEEIRSVELFLRALHGMVFDAATWRVRTMSWLRLGGERGVMALRDPAGPLLACFRFEVEGPPEARRVLNVGDVACAELGGTSVGVRSTLKMIRELAATRACGEIRLQLDGSDDNLAYRGSAERFGFVPTGTVWSAAAQHGGVVLPFARPALHRH